MTGGQIHHVDVIAHTGAVVGGVVIAVYVEHFPLAYGHLRNVRGQIIGNTGGILADETALVGADRVEITEQSHVQSGVGSAVIGENALNKQLGGAVRIGGAAGGGLLTDRHGFGISVNRGGGGEHEILHIVSAHDVQQVQRADQIVGVVFQGLGNALADCFQTCEMDHGVDVGILGKEGFDLGDLAQLGALEGDFFAGDLHYTADSLLAGVAEVVGHNDVITGFDQFDTGVAADIAGAAAHQNGHNGISFL